MTKTLLTSTYLALLLCPLLSPAALAQNEDIDKLLELDIESLANVIVSTASKRNEKINEAPGIVSILTSEDIQRYGGKSLYDVIARLPHTYINRSFALLPTSTGVDTRGQTTQETSNRILTLLDGRPIRESQLGGWDQAFYHSFPIELIERVEMIRGPGSVLYGTNAFSGVINFITKKPENNVKKDKKYHIATGYGTFNTKTLEASAQKYFPEHDISLTAAINRYDTNGFDYSLKDSTGTSDSFNLYRDALGGYFRTKYGGLTISGFTGQTENATLGLSTTFPTGKHSQERNFFDIGYTQPLWGDWEAALNITYNGFENYAFETGTVFDDNEFNDVLYEASLSGSLFDDLNILAGVTYDDRNGSLKVGPAQNFAVAIEGAYFQADYKPWDWLKLIGGIQLNKPENFETPDKSPRAGAIVHFTPEIGAKFLYGEAFRSPTASENSILIPGILTGNSELKNEKIETTDIQLFYNTQNTYAALTYYESSVSGTIGTGLNPNPPPLITFLNSTGEIEYKGIEFEGKSFINDHFEIQGSLTYQWGKDQNTGNQDIGVSPHFMAKLGGSYISDNGITIGIHDQYIDDVVAFQTDVATAPRFNPEVKPTHLITANMDFNLNQLLQLSDSTPDTKFSFFIDNVLDENIYVADPNSEVNTLPGYSGRAIYGKLSLKF